MENYEGIMTNFGKLFFLEYKIHCYDRDMEEEPPKIISELLQPHH